LNTNNDIYTKSDGNYLLKAKKTVRVYKGAEVDGRMEKHEGTYAYVCLSV